MKSNDECIIRVINYNVKFMAISNAEARSLIMGALYYSGPKVDPKEVGRIFNYTGEIEGNGRRQFGEFLLGSFTLQGLEVIMKLDQDKRLEVLASAWDLGEKYTGRKWLYE